MERTVVIGIAAEELVAGVSDFSADLPTDAFA